MLPGTTAAGWAASEVGAEAAGAAAAGAFWAGALAVVCAAAGVSPAAAKAIAHPISLIFTPVSYALGRERETPRPIDFAVSISAGFQTLKRLFQDVIGLSVDGARAAA
jgi:hypothetical protein